MTAFYKRSAVWPLSRGRVASIELKQGRGIAIVPNMIPDTRGGVTRQTFVESVSLFPPLQRSYMPREAFNKQGLKDEKTAR